VRFSNSLLFNLSSSLLSPSTCPPRFSPLQSVLHASLPEYRSSKNSYSNTFTLYCSSDLEITSSSDGENYNEPSQRRRELFARVQQLRNRRPLRFSPSVWAFLQAADLNLMEKKLLEEGGQFCGNSRRAVTAWRTPFWISRPKTP
jgi:hypothetical protein